MSEKNRKRFDYNCIASLKMGGSLTRKLKRIRIFWTYPIIGLVSTIWFLIRVIPKPSRVNYPCMRVAAPFASSFIAYLIGSAGLVFAFRKARKRVYEARYLVAAGFIAIGLAAGVVMISNTGERAYANYADDPHPPNVPFGEAKGIFPGRVVWVHNPDATNKECTNTSNDYWWMDANNDQVVIDNMLSQSLQSLTGAATDNDAWDALFRYFNTQKDKGDVGYTSGEKIVIKINLGCEWSRHVNSTYEWWDYGDLDRIDSTPHMILAILRQLINQAGIPQENISIGDMIRNFTGPYWDKCHGEFPNVKYLGVDGRLGRTDIVSSDDPVVFYSDGEDQDRLPVNIIEADYLINLPCLKAHARAGITISAKNHFGSHCRGDAEHLHRSLPSPDQDGDYSNGGMGNYRCLVDLLGHEHLGGKTMLIVVDGIWGAGEAVYPPNKWKSAPFNNDWPSSLIVSQDPVAVESVCFDFLYEEYSSENYNSDFFMNLPYAFPHMPGVQDYLHQAADTTNWPDDIKYDPENDGTPLSSLGVHEHWNNPTDKQYSRDLGTGEGIELIKISGASAIHNDASIAANKFVLIGNYPNPFNISTTIRYELPIQAFVELSIYNMNGEQVRHLVREQQSSGAYFVQWDGTSDRGKVLSSGTYLYELKAALANRTLHIIDKMLLIK